ncbi:unnamed protein product [Phytophthora fragariaefolia]|uniref:Unnamed protein product n=1 Tax=Phytophthora fragariaefolia TaxID=1490495 RepID=A0A9W6XJS5_9STRA|nr:unnamed protein product [Phytophthora fragariaefolia]
MGKASRRKQLEEQRKQFFAINGDGRSAEDRANARAMLDALQKKLEDDALREDGLLAYSLRAGSTLDVSSSNTLFICGAAAWVQTSNLDAIVFAKGTISQSEASARAFDVANNYCTGHQQAISSMAFSHVGELLATASWDSTCMIWKVTIATTSDNPPVPSNLPNQGRKMNEVVRFMLLMVLPVHEEGASCLAFTHDDQALITCGECVIKLWSISAASTDNQAEDDKMNELPSLTDHLQEWQQAIPFSFSIESSTNLFGFDESVTSLVANHDWINFRKNTERLTLLAPTQTEDERNEAIDVRQCVDYIIEEIDQQEDEGEELLNSLISNVGESEERVRSENNSTDGKPNTLSDINVLTPEERARLRTQFRNMENFDFERLFTPALSLSLGLDRGIDSIPAKTMKRIPVRPDANGQLIRSFAKCTAVSNVLETVFDAHITPITCCALTSPTTCDPRKYEMLLATGGADNLVKVWRRSASARAECVYSLSGHNDAIKSLVFDPSGIFLISSSEDTTAIMWRVRPSSPDQPEIPTVVSVDRFSINISWVEPLANGAKILHYVVRTTQASAFSGDGCDIVQVQDAEVPAKYLSKNIDKLQPGVKYTLQVAAVNQVRLVMNP